MRHKTIIVLVSKNNQFYFPQCETAQSLDTKMIHGFKKRLLLCIDRKADTPGNPQVSSLSTLSTFVLNLCLTPCANIRSRRWEIVDRKPCLPAL